jgi:hypothetical protein
MRYFACMLIAAMVATLGFASTALTQTQPHRQTMGTSIPGPQEGRPSKAECERLADEKRLRGKRRTRAINKCVDTGKM